MADFSVTVLETPALEVIVELAGAGSGASTWDELSGKPTTFPPETHNHDDRYYTETESDGRYLQSVPASYATDAEVSASLASAITDHEALSNPHPVYLTQTEADALYKALGYVPAWTEITGKPSTFAPSAHASSHQPGGSDAMAVDAAAATGSLRTLGTTSTSAAAGNDARLSDNRTPSDSSVTNAKVSASAAIDESKLSLASDAAAGTASRRTLGTGATQAAAGNHSHAASGVSFTPTGTVAATDVQAAIAEVASEASAASNYRTLVTLGSDQSNSTTTLADVTGLSFAVTSGTTYRFYFLIIFSAQATTTGSRWTISGPTATLLGYKVGWSNGAGSFFTDTQNNYNVGTATGNSTFTSGNIATIEGILLPSASGTLIARFASEAPGTNNQITAKAGSTLEYF